MSMAEELPVAQDASTPAPALAAGRISTGQALLFGLAGLSLGGIFASEGSYLASAGYSGWLTLVVALAFALVLAVVVTRFARKHVVSGSLMSYLRLEIGPKSGVFTGSALFIGYAGAITTYLGMSVYFGTSALAGFGLAEPSMPASLAIGAVIVAFCCVLARRGVSVSVNVAIVLGLLVVPLVLVIIGAAVMQAGLPIVPQLTLEGFELATFVPALVVAFALFCGFEGLTALAAETRDPKRTVPIVVISLVAILGVAGISGVLLTLPIMLTHGDQLVAGASPLAVMAEVGHVGWLSGPADLLMAVSAVGSLLAYLNDSSRVVATAGRDEFLPAWLGRIEPRYHTPARAIFVIGSVAWVLLAGFVAVSGSGMFDAVVGYTAFVSYSWLLAYVAVAVAGGLAAWRASQRWFALACAATTVFLLAVLGYSFSTAVQAGGTSLAFPVIVLIAIVALLLIGIVRTRRVPHPSPVPPA